MRTYRRDRDEHAEIHTRPHNTGASSAACGIVRELLKLDGMQDVIAADMENHSGFIATLCRNVDRTLKELKEYAETCERLRKRDASISNAINNMTAIANYRHNLQLEIEAAQAYAEEEPDFPLVPMIL